MNLENYSTRELILEVYKRSQEGVPEKVVKKSYLNNRIYLNAKQFEYPQRVFNKNIIEIRNQDVDNYLIEILEYTARAYMTWSPLAVERIFTSLCNSWFENGEDEGRLQKMKIAYSYKNPFYPNMIK